MKKIILLMLIALISAMLFVGCGDSTETGETIEGNPPLEQEQTSDEDSTVLEDDINSQEFMNVTFNCNEAAEPHTVTLTKLDDAGNLVEFEYDGHPIELTEATSEYFETENMHVARFYGFYPGYYFEIEYIFEDDPSYGEEAMGRLELQTGWNEGKDADAPFDYICDGYYFK